MRPRGITTAVTNTASIEHRESATSVRQGVFRFHAAARRSPPVASIRRAQRSDSQYDHRRVSSSLPLVNEPIRSWHSHQSAQSARAYPGSCRKDSRFVCRWQRTHPSLPAGGFISRISRRIWLSSCLLCRLFPRLFSPSPSLPTLCRRHASIKRRAWRFPYIHCPGCRRRLSRPFGIWLPRAFVL